MPACCSVPVNAEAYETPERAPPAAVCSVAVVAVLGVLVFSGRSGAVDCAQSAMTATMVGMFAALVATGLPQVDAALLDRAEWPGLAGSFAVLLQLLSFSEVR